MRPPPRPPLEEEVIDDGGVSSSLATGIVTSRDVMVQSAGARTSITVCPNRSKEREDEDRWGALMDLAMRLVGLAVQASCE